MFKQKYKHTHNHIDSGWCPSQTNLTVKFACESLLALIPSYRMANACSFEEWAKKTTGVSDASGENTKPWLSAVPSIRQYSPISHSKGKRMHCMLKQLRATHHSKHSEREREDYCVHCCYRLLHQYWDWLVKYPVLVDLPCHRIWCKYSLFHNRRGGTRSICSEPDTHCSHTWDIHST